MKIVCIKMRYSIEPRDRIYVKVYGFLSFAENMGKSLSNKYGQKLLDSVKKSTTDAIKTASQLHRNCILKNYLIIIIITIITIIVILEM